MSITSTARRTRNMAGSTRPARSRAAEIQYVYGDAYYDTVESGGYQYVENGGFAYQTTLYGI